MRRITHLVVLAAFVLSCGGHWCVLQCVAWAGMIHEYSQVVPLTEAVSMTFSGKYPCALCKAIAEKKQSENDKLCSLDKYEKKFFPPVAPAATAPAPVAFVYPGYLNFLQGRSEPPPTPPPRLA